MLMNIHLLAKFKSSTLPTPPFSHWQTDRQLERMSKLGTFHDTCQRGRTKRWLVTTIYIEDQDFMPQRLTKHSATGLENEVRNWN